MHGGFNTSNLTVAIFLKLLFCLKRYKKGKLKRCFDSRLREKNQTKHGFKEKNFCSLFLSTNITIRYSVIIFQYNPFIKTQHINFLFSGTDKLPCCSTFNLVRVVR